MTEGEVRRAIGYIRVSTEDQAESGAGLEAQRVAIWRAVQDRGWCPPGTHGADIYQDTASGRTVAKRTALEAALAVLARGEADALVVAKLDRLTRSVSDYAALLERARREGWVMVCLDVSVDTSTPAGEAMANMMSVFAQFERRMIGLRTKEALAQRRAAGVRLGRPVQVTDGVVETIVRWRSGGVSLEHIASRLNGDGIAAPRGGLWRRGSVAAIIRRVNTQPGTVLTRTRRRRTVGSILPQGGN